MTEEIIQQVFVLGIVVGLIMGLFVAGSVMLYVMFTNPENNNKVIDINVKEISRKKS